jgi:hypothetical protein
MTAESKTDPAALCLTWGYARDGDACCDCEDGIYPSAFVSVGRLDVGRLCEDCARRTPLGYVAEALAQLDTAVFLAHDQGDVPAAVMALNVQRAVDYMVENEWLPRYAADVPDGAE